MNIDKILDKFPDKTKKNFINISDRFEKENSSSVNLERDITLLILDFIEKTPSDDNSIMKVSYLFVNVFKNYSLDERIQKAIEIFYELQLPDGFEDEFELEKWNKARMYLLEFMDDENLLDEEEIK